MAIFGETTEVEQEQAMLEAGLLREYNTKEQDEYEQTYYQDKKESDV